MEEPDPLPDDVIHIEDKKLQKVMELYNMLSPAGKLLLARRVEEKYGPIKPVGTVVTTEMENKSELNSTHSASVQESSETDTDLVVSVVADGDVEHESDFNRFSPTQRSSDTNRDVVSIPHERDSALESHIASVPVGPGDSDNGSDNPTSVDAVPVDDSRQQDMAPVSVTLTSPPDQDHKCTVGPHSVQSLHSPLGHIADFHLARSPDIVISGGQETCKGLGSIGPSSVSTSEHPSPKSLSSQVKVKNKPAWLSMAHWRLLQKKAQCRRQQQTTYSAVL